MADTSRGGTPPKDRKPENQDASPSCGGDRFDELYELFTLERRLEKLDVDRYGVSPVDPPGRRYKTGTRSDPKKDLSTGKLLARGVGYFFLVVGVWGLLFLFRAFLRGL